MTKKIEVELPVIPRSVADCVDALRWSGHDDEEITSMSTRDTGGLLRLVPFKTLIRALSVGWETEKTAEELAEEKRKQAHETLRKRYQELSLKIADAFNPCPAEFMRDELVSTLVTLGIKIEGVNA